MVIRCVKICVKNDGGRWHCISVVYVTDQELIFEDVNNAEDNATIQLKYCKYKKRSYRVYCNQLFYRMLCHANMDSSAMVKLAEVLWRLAAKNDKADRNMMVSFVC